MDERQAFEKLLDLLDLAMARMGAMHSPSVDFGTGKPLYRAEIHTVRAIGENPGINVTRLAEAMGVTKGAVSQTVKKLVRKGLVGKTQAEDNAKEILLELTNPGWTAFHNHEKFHMEMFHTVKKYFGNRLKRKLNMTITVLEDINGVLNMYERMKMKK